MRTLMRSSSGKDAFRSSKSTLQGHRAFYSVHHAGEFSQQSVAHEFEDAAVVAGDFGFE